MWLQLFYRSLLIKQHIVVIPQASCCTMSFTTQNAKSMPFTFGLKRKWVGRQAYMYHQHKLAIQKCYDDFLKSEAFKQRVKCNLLLFYWSITLKKGTGICYRYTVFLHVCSLHKQLKEAWCIWEFNNQYLYSHGTKLKNVFLVSKSLKTMQCSQVKHILLNLM